MKKVLFMAVAAVLFGALSSFAVGQVNDGGAAKGVMESEEDSSVAVMAWFDKSDTLTYWISEGEWEVRGNDTVQTMNLATKVMLTVTDSTKKGYDIEYRFLEFCADTIPGSPLSSFMSSLANNFGSKVVGTSIRFHTDEYGQIEKYYNLREIKKQAKTIYKDACAELMRLPELDSMRKAGVDIGALMKKVDTDELVQGYVEELELMFNYHGLEFKLGDSKTHREATADNYASDTYIVVDRDTETKEYGIAVNVDTYVPAEDITAMLGTIVESVGGKELPEEFNREFTKYVKEPVVFNSYFSVRYLPCGWPVKVLSQDCRMIVTRGKLKQTSILLNSCNFY